MERFKIGYSRTHKLITSQPDVDSLEKPEDRFDAMAMLDTVAARIFKAEGDTVSVRDLQRYLDRIRLDLLAEDSYERLMQEAGCKTSLDLRRYAQGLLLPEFKD